MIQVTKYVEVPFIDADDSMHIEVWQHILEKTYNEVAPHVFDILVPIQNAVVI